MTAKSELIVLNSTKVGEGSLVVHTLSSEWGRRSFITNVPKGGRMALFMPMSILEAEIAENPRTDLRRMKAIGTQYPLNSIRMSVAKNSMTMFMSEVLYRAIHDGACEDGLYEWCRKAVMTLDTLESDFSNYHLRFLLELSAVMGFMPSAEDIAPFAGERLRDIENLITSRMEDFLLYPLNGRSRNEIAEALLRYIGYHSGCQINVRSLGVLSELFR